MKSNRFGIALSAMTAGAASFMFGNNSQDAKKRSLYERFGRSKVVKTGTLSRVDEYKRTPRACKQCGTLHDHKNSFCSAKCFREHATKAAPDQEFALNV